MPETRLRPCPWCGGRQDTPEGEYSGLSNRQRFVCGHCCARGPTGVDEGEAAAKWNTRPVEDELLATLNSFGVLSCTPEWLGRRAEVTARARGETQ